MCQKNCSDVVDSVFEGSPVRILAWDLSFQFLLSFSTSRLGQFSFFRYRYVIYDKQQFQLKIIVA